MIRQKNSSTVVKHFRVASLFCAVLLMLELCVVGLSPVMAGTGKSALAEQFFAKGLGYYWAQDMPQHYDEAFVWLLKSAENGHPRAQSILADMYNNGLGIPIDYREGWNFTQASANQGDVYGQFLLGKALYKGLGVEKDSEKGTKMLSQILNVLEVEAGLGDAHTQFSLAWIYDTLSSATRDYQKARYWYEKAAVHGYAVAQNNLGWMFGNGDGGRKNAKAKMVWYRRAAGQNYPMAQYNLALSLRATNDINGIYNLFLQAANQNYGPAQSELGWIAEKGKGRPVDLENAVVWYHKAATQNHRWTQNHLGAMYEKGTGVPQDYQEAMMWYRFSADRGYGSAIANIGHLYEEGFGVEKNYVEARLWYERGAEKGNTYSQARLGYLYLYGLGVDKDLEEANEWLLKAGRGGDEWAYYGVGLIHEEQREYSQAIRWYLLAAINGYNFGLKRAVYLMVLYPVISLRT